MWLILDGRIESENGIFPEFSVFFSSKQFTRLSEYDRSGRTPSRPCPSVDEEAEEEWLVISKIAIRVC